MSSFEIGQEESTRYFLCACDFAILSRVRFMKLNSKIERLLEIWRIYLVQK